MEANFNLCFSDISDAENEETDRQSNRFVQPVSEVRTFCVLMVMLFLFLQRVRVARNAERCTS